MVADHKKAVFRLPVYCFFYDLITGRGIRAFFFSTRGAFRLKKQQKQRRLRLTQPGITAVKNEDKGMYGEQMSKKEPAETLDSKGTQRA